MVEECSKAEIGVGADIALINQPPMGACALLLKGENRKQSTNNGVNSRLQKKKFNKFGETYTELLNKPVVMHPEGLMLRPRNCSA